MQKALGLNNHDGSCFLSVDDLNEVLEHLFYHVLLYSVLLGTQSFVTLCSTFHGA